MTQPRRNPGRPAPGRRPGATRNTDRQRANPGRVTPSRATPARDTDRVRITATRVAGTDHARSASRPATARRAAAGGAANRTSAPQPHRFTGRATVLGLVLGVLLLAYAYPIRIYLNQQSQIASLESGQTTQRQDIHRLRDLSAKWSDPTYIKTQARQRLQMVEPGTKVFIVARSGEAAQNTGPNAGEAKDTGPWYGQLWSSVQAADKPRSSP